MKTFEERYTAWIDGKLAGAELAAFERELEDRPAADLDKEAALQIGGLLRRYGSPALANADFFNHQLMERIERDAAPPEPVRRGSRFLVFLPWMRAATAAALAITLGWSIARVMETNPGKPAGGPVAKSGYLAKIIDAKALEPGVSASVIEDGDDNLTVLWLDGLEYLPASYELQ